jgi:Uncharacterized protein conserved in bacteria (DUF2066)
MLYRVFRAAGFAALLLLLAVPLGMADDDFTVSNVHEDVTAASALAARDQALAQGQQQAFQTLMARLAPGSPPRVTPDQLTDLIASFEVANERTSSVRYVADYTFHFKPNAVRQLLQQAGTSYAAPVRPVVVLPVFRSGGETVLWDDPNPWRDAWADHVTTPGQLPVVVPVGDLTDVSLIDVPKALAGDAAAIGAMSARHQNDDVVVALAQLKAQPTRLEITLTRYSGAGAGAPQTIDQVVSQHPGETESALFTRAVGFMILRLAQSWQSANAVNTSHVGTLEVRVPVTNFSDWIAIRDRLRGVGLVRGVDLVSFSAAEVEAAIRYVGDEGQLRTALAGAGLDLEGGDPDWTLTLRAAGATPPRTASPVPPPASVEASPPAAPPGTAPGGAGAGPDGLRRANDQP